MKRRKKRAAKKMAIRKVPKKMDKLQLEDWNQVESKLFDSITEKEVEPNRNNNFEIGEQQNLWNEWQEDWLFGDIDRAQGVNDINPDKKNPFQ